MKKTIALLSTILLIGASASGSILHANAALTAPNDYDLAFKSDNNIFGYTSANGSSPSTVALFNQTSSMGYFNYDHDNFGLDGIQGTSDDEHSNLSNYEFPQGFRIKMSFQRSTTSWTIATPYLGYYASDVIIGSNNSVGSISKLRFDFDNQTTHDYSIYLDFTSSNNNNFVYNVFYNDNIHYEYDNNVSRLLATSHFAKLYIPSFTKLSVYTLSDSSQYYLDAWYLQDLGTSVAYTEGVDYGYNNPPFDTLIGSTLESMATILNIQILGNAITIGTILLFPLLAIVFFTFKKVIQ